MRQGHVYPSNRFGTVHDTSFPLFVSRNILLLGVFTYLMYMTVGVVCRKRRVEVVSRTILVFGTETRSVWSDSGRLRELTFVVLDLQTTECTSYGSLYRLSTKRTSFKDLSRDPSLRVLPLSPRGICPLFDFALRR